jgi:DNA-binding NarL/FixJ family response regulator
MDYTFNYIAGGIGTITVDEQWAGVLAMLDHEELDNNRRETRRHVYLSTMSRVEDRLVASEPNPLQVVCRVESAVELLEKLATLTPRQLEVLKMRLAGLKQEAIASNLGISQPAVVKVQRLTKNKFSR